MTSPSVQSVHRSFSTELIASLVSMRLHLANVLNVQDTITSIIVAKCAKIIQIKLSALDALDSTITVRYVSLVLQQRFLTGAASVWVLCGLAEFV